MAGAGPARQTERAYDYATRAEKKMKSFALTASGRQARAEDAAELHANAGNAFKIAKEWVLAGEQFTKAARLQLSVGNKHEAATAFVDAANALKKANAEAAIEVLEEAVELFTDIGRFSIAAKHKRDVAELWEGDGDVEKACAAFQVAGDFYSSDDSVSHANTCFRKVAQFNAQLERYEEAIQMYEQIAAASVDNHLLRFGVRDDLLNAGLCHVALGDAVAARRALERYQELDMSFTQTREFTLFEGVVEAFEAQDVEKFNAAIFEYDKVKRLDPFRTSLLLRIKKALQAEGAGIM